MNGVASALHADYPRRVAKREKKEPDWVRAGVKAMGGPGKTAKTLGKHRTTVQRWLKQGTLRGVSAETVRDFWRASRLSELLEPRGLDSSVLTPPPIPSQNEKAREDNSSKAQGVRRGGGGKRGTTA